MEKSKQIIIKFLVVFILIFCVDGGRSFFHFSNNMEILLTNGHSNDIEIPHQDQLNNYFEDVKWVESSKSEFSYFNYNSIIFRYSANIAPQEIINAIWQPPKFI
jgi:hypothetical protein